MNAAPSLFSPEQIEQLRAGYAHIERASVDFVPKFRRVFDGCSDEQLEQLARAGIKFVSKLALNACMRRGLELKEAA